jgi:superfamily I DNA/RNA helicase
LRVLAQRAEQPLAEWLDALAVGDEAVPVDDEVVHVSSVHQTDEVVHVSSVHQAKGREFRATFILGLEEGLVPHHRALRGTDASEAALEEELRVLDVALTRARERLYLSACRERTRGSQVERRQPSRWLSALPPELVAPAA